MPQSGRNSCEAHSVLGRVSFQAYVAFRSWIIHTIVHATRAGRDGRAFHLGRADGLPLRPSLIETAKLGKPADVGWRNDSRYDCSRVLADGRQPGGRNTDFHNR